MVPSEPLTSHPALSPQTLACSSGHPGILVRGQPKCANHPTAKAALRLYCREITGCASIPYRTTDDAGLASVGELASRVPDPRELSPSRPVPVLTRFGLHQQPKTTIQGDAESQESKNER